MSRILEGTVVSVDPKNNIGLIRDTSGREFMFTQWECKDSRLPEKFERVTFKKDEDYRIHNIAIEVHSGAA
jgi:hypothetical protein